MVDVDDLYADCPALRAAHNLAEAGNVEDAKALGHRLHALAERYWTLARSLPQDSDERTLHLEAQNSLRIIASRFHAPPR